MQVEGGKEREYPKVLRRIAVEFGDLSPGNPEKR